MMRPIDADALYSKLHSIGGCDAKDEWAKGYDDGVSAAIDCLQDAPTLDVVPVVRCKECLFSEKRHYLGDTCLYCKQFCDFMEESDFCCRAERKDGEQDATD